MNYTASHIIRLQDEASRRFNGLLCALDTDHKRGSETVTMSGVDVRLAVDNFKNILTEIRRIK